MKEKAERYLAFVDYLGTGDLYRSAAVNADLIVERRNELEHAIQILLQPYVAARDIEIGVFSDTVLIAGSSLQRVVHCSSLLMRFVLKKTVDRDDQTDCRLVRGGVAKGIELRTSYLRPSPQVHVIPFFDGSLAFSYELEGVRRGSRLFFSETVGRGELGDLSKFVFEWKSISGFGIPTVGIHEFMWPGYLYKDAPSELAALVSRAFAQWRRYLVGTKLTPEQYRSTLYHFDETIKCMVRSFISLTGTSSAQDAIGICAQTILPCEGDLKEDCDIRHVWGFWFQVLLVLSAANLIPEYASAISLTKRELIRRSYLDRFVAEAEYPEYAPVKVLFEKPIWN